jgi:hypothetical protein
MKQPPPGVDKLTRQYHGGVSVVEEPREPVLVVVPPEEALRRARPLPSADDFAIEGLTPEEWSTLNAVLAER